MELTVLSCIDVEVDEFSGTLVAILHLRTEGDDRTLADINRYALVGSLNDEPLTTSDEFTRIQIVPTRLLGEIDTAVTRLIIAHGAGHQCRTEHPLVLDIQHLAVTVEVHHEATHHGVVLRVNPACHRVEIGHEAIAQTVVIDKRLVTGMILWCDIPYFTRRPLTMHAEQRDKGAELTPTGLQLAPLLQVFVLHLRAVVQLLGGDIAVLHTETTLIHTPEGQS